MDQVLVFLLGKERFALEVAHIQEIVESPPFYYIPLAPSVFPGAINFHGSILPVVDLGACLGGTDKAQDVRIIVLAAALCTLALAVTAIQRIVALDPDELLPARITGPLAEFSRAAFNLEDEPIHLLDAARLVARLEKIDMGTGGDHGG
jgi:purine-binding chemotaxis protein CheW